jgi:hypothetical protein
MTGEWGYVLDFDAKRLGIYEGDGHAGIAAVELAGLPKPKEE